MISVIVLWLVGLGLGGLYFGGLWMTLRRLPRWHHPFLAMGLSLLCRLVVLLGMGGLFLRYPIASPFQTVLTISFGVWLSRMMLISAALSISKRSVSKGLVLKSDEVKKVLDA
ncbi:hypothetical protein S7335_243 [Synechococcus sp. PCC 7335]|uniref:N-ATPase subunit AtpR n=1 Tax=Synechococcus sp. (strain ATCC 29403 / PCC 7335) TaxID=91464 RepID=UPI00017ED658|nr:ATP synthase subunit I [Synechococcus sp. PCC 7335]EDX83065.1 hypothetical protein S7335_243 [Synechococcus sp. PCC 7335]